MEKHNDQTKKRFCCSYQSALKRSFTNPERNVAGTSITPSNCPHSTTNANQDGLFPSKYPPQIVKEEQIGFNAQTKRMIAVRGNQNNDIHPKATVVIPQRKVFYVNPRNVLRHRTNSVQSHTDEEVVRVVQKHSQAAFREQLPAIKVASKEESGLRNTPIHSLSKACSSFPHRQRNGHVSSTTTRMLDRRQAVTNAPFGAQRTGFCSEKTDITMLPTTSRQQINKVPSDDNRTGKERRRRRVAVLLCDDVDRRRCRRIGVCPSLDSTKREREYVRVLCKRF